ncbi:MAG: FecR domain-containing protein [Cyclobacteriaceae bacterium]
MEDHKDYLKNEWFQRWVAKDDDEEANNYWKSWMEENPALKKDLIENRELVRSMSFEEHTVGDDHINDSWHEVRDSINQTYHLFSIKGAVKIAAAIALLLASIFIWQGNIKIKTDGHHLADEKSIVKHAEKGTKLTVQLSDGTKIKLNGGSKLIYPEVFGSQSREVELVGEGFFDVAHEKDRPFIVKAGKINTTVLGTRFAVNAMNEDKVQVALVSGKVKVENKNHEDNGSSCNTMLLEPGMKAIYSDNCLQRSKIDKLMDLGWKDGIIAFENSSVREVASRLEQWYGVSIQLKHAEKISSSFNGVYKNETLPNVLNSIAHSLNFTYKINKNTVYINGI